MPSTTPTVQYFDGATWQTLTHVRSYSYTSGRRDELSGASAGMATFVLDNADSTFVGVGTNLLPKMTPMRVMVNGNTQPRWSGWSDGSPVTFPDPEGTMSLVTVTAHDSLALMQRHTCQTSIYEETLTYAVQTGANGSITATACGYWPMSDSAGSKTAYEASGAQIWGALTPMGASTGTFGASGVNAAQSTALAIPALQNVTLSTGTASVGSIANGVTMGIWFQSAGGSGLPLLRLNFGANSFVDLDFSGGFLVFESFDPSSGTTQALTLEGPVKNGNWHYLMGVLSASGALSLYVDGALAGSASAPAGWAPASAAVGAVLVNGFSGANLCHAWIGLGANPAAAAIFNAATLNLGGLTSTQLLSKLARWGAPNPISAAVIDGQNNGTSTPVAGVAFAGNDCLTLAQVASDTEDGPLYCTRSGAIANLTHDTLTDRAIGTATAAFVNGDEESDLTFSRDAQFMVTNCQITALSGSGGVQTASRNLARFGNYQQQKSLYVTDYQALDYANARAALYGDIDYSRIGQFTIDLLNSTDIQTAALAVDIGSRVTFSGLPTQGGYTTADVIVQGFTENWTINGWSISFNTTPSSNYLSWVLEDATYGLLDSTTVLGY